MVTIRLKAFSVLKEVFGARTLSLFLPSGSVVRDILYELNARYGATYRRETDRDLIESLSMRFNIFLNNKLLAFPEGFEVVLREGDELVILQPSSGG